MKTEFCTTRQAAETLGLSVYTVRDYFRLGYIKGIKVGWMTLIPIDEIDRVKKLRRAGKPWVEITAGGEIARMDTLWKRGRGEQI